MTHLTITTEHITLATALKVAGLADTGGQAKVLVRNGLVTVNSEVELRPGRKLLPGDRIHVENGPECTISR